VVREQDEHPMPPNPKPLSRDLAYLVIDGVPILGEAL
jgi:hypothetical protein